MIQALTFLLGNSMQKYSTSVYTLAIWNRDLCIFSTAIHWRNIRPFNLYLLNVNRCYETLNRSRFIGLNFHWSLCKVIKWVFSRNSLRNSLRRSKFYCVEHSNSSTELFHYLLMLFWFHAQSVWVIDQTICMLNPQLVRLQQKEFAWPNKGFKQPICNRPQRLTHNTLTP